MKVAFLDETLVQSIADNSLQEITFSDILFMIQRRRQGGIWGLKPPIGSQEKHFFEIYWKELDTVLKM